MEKEYADILENLDWDWFDGDNTYYLERFTPITKEDRCWPFSKDNFIESIRKYAEKLNPEYYCDESTEGVLYESEEAMNYICDLYMIEGEEMKELFMELVKELEKAEIESEVA